jgi:RNA polymerase sigma factor (sigma-70 family)
MPVVSERSDVELWRRAAADHGAAAFGELFERHADAVYNHLFRRTASWSTAEELTSIVFLTAWRRRGTANLFGDSVLPWLLAVGNNVVRNAERARRRYGRLLAKLPPPSDGADFGDEAAARADDERLMAAVLRSLSVLRDEEREVVALCDWSGLTQAEAAAALGIPAGTVGSRLARAHAHLRRALEPSPGVVDAPVTVELMVCPPTVDHLEAGGTARRVGDHVLGVSDGAVEAMAEAPVTEELW